MSAALYLPTPEESLLVADIGGTNARFALWHQGALHLQRVYKCASYAGPAAAATQFLQDLRTTQSLPVPRAAVFAVAAPLLGDRVALTNNGWDFSAAETRKTLGLERLIFLNDFTALALAIPVLTADERWQVGGGAPRPGTAIAVLGPGTGLGVSGLLPVDGHWLAVQGEGGHVTLPPVDEREIAVVTRIHRQYSHVSAERILSGSGLELLHRTLAQVDGLAPGTLNAEVITRQALDGSDARCRESVSIFCGWLGNVAGNLALTLGATGGVYIGGGIIPQLGNFFATSPFRTRFEAKGRYTTYLAAIPVYVITAQFPALVGCAQAFAHPSSRLEAA